MRLPVFDPVLAANLLFCPLPLLPCTRSAQHAALAAAALAGPEAIISRHGDDYREPSDISRRRALAILSSWMGGLNHQYPSPILTRGGNHRWVMAPPGLRNPSDQEVVELLNTATTSSVVYGCPGGPCMATLDLDSHDGGLSLRLHTLAESMHAVRAAALLQDVPEVLAHAWASSRATWARAICDCDCTGWGRPAVPFSCQNQRPIVFRPAINWAGPERPAAATPPSPSPSPTGAAGPSPPVSPGALPVLLAPPLPPDAGRPGTPAPAPPAPPNGARAGASPDAGAPARAVRAPPSGRAGPPRARPPQGPARPTGSRGRRGPGHPEPRQARIASAPLSFFGLPPSPRRPSPRCSHQRPIHAWAQRLATSASPITPSTRLPRRCLASISSPPYHPPGGGNRTRSVTAHAMMLSLPNRLS